MIQIAVLKSSIKEAWTGRRGSGNKELTRVDPIIAKRELSSKARTEMPKRPADERGRGRSAKPPKQRKHLYLVLNDWGLGYSIRKVDLSSGFDSDEPEDGRAEQGLPPAVFRLEAPHGRSGQFAAFGTKIMFMGTKNNPWRTVPMYDVRTRAHTAAPRRYMSSVASMNNPKKVTSMNLAITVTELQITICM